jgi:adenosylhomocysteinase
LYASQDERKDALTAGASVQHDIRDPRLAEEGVRRIEWAEREMPVIRAIRARFARERPLRDVRLSGCLHVTTETANLALALRDGGAQVALCASNPLSTQDDVAAALVHEYGIATFAIKGEDNETYYRHIHQALEQQPQLTMDDGADLVATIHRERRDLLDTVLGGTEETTTGVIRLRAMARDGALAYPIIAVNEANTKHLFDNRYGTGQSTLDGITRATNILWAGKQVVVIGYGWCGRGVAMRARGLGSQVIVCEVDPLRALEAVMDGYRVLPMEDAAAIGDIFISVTGDVNAIDRHHMEAMKDGAILANSGHFNVELNIEALAGMAEARRQVRPFVEEFRLGDGRRLFLLGEGRLINLAAAEGHPASVMDMSFANQALSVEHLVLREERLAPDVYPVPREIDEEIARLKLAALGVHIDVLTDEQRKYLSSWEEGT